MIQIYTVGIRGKNDEINETQLMVIATDPTLYEILDDYTPETTEDYDKTSLHKSVDVSD